MAGVIDVTKNPVLMRWRREALEEGRTLLLMQQLQRKFGKLPKWAELRVAEARPAQIVRWADKILTATTLEQVLGKQ